MRRQKHLAIWVALAVLTTACATARVFEMDKLQGDMAQTLHKSDEIMGKASNDYREKTALYESLKKSIPPSFADLKRTLKAASSAWTPIYAPWRQSVKS
ncbi:MAG: hypothetical protein HC902_12710 [Calothrix sp. SM1_5_4]|nr:hypothetical protein [Calothrix sp. SM1_5_4]